jgi:hypothetical protein
MLLRAASRPKFELYSALTCVHSLLFSIWAFAELACHHADDLPVIKDSEAVQYVTNSIFSADGFYAILFTLFQYRQPFGDRALTCN